MTMLNRNLPGQTPQSIGIVGLGSLGSVLFQELIRVYSTREDHSSETSDSSNFENTGQSAPLLIAYTSRPEDVEYIKTSAVFEALKTIDVQIRPLQTLKHDIDLPQWLFLTVPDHVLPDITSELSQNTFSNWSTKSVIHCSGAHSSVILDKLASFGARTASLHPLQTFPSRAALYHYESTKSYSSDASHPSIRFFGIPCSVEGDVDLCTELLDFFTEGLHAKAFRVSVEQKRALHLAAVLASNGVVALFSSAREILRKAGIENGFSLLQPLVEQTFKNVYLLGENALSGPAKRGDVSTVHIHLDDLKNAPELQYRYALSGLMVLSLLPEEVQHQSGQEKLYQLFSEIVSREPVQ